MAHDIFCEKRNGCYLGQQQMLFGAFSFFVKRASVLLFGGIPIPCSYAGGWGWGRGDGAVPRFTGMTQNTGTTTNHRNDDSNMKKKIPSGSGDVGGKG